MTDQEHQLVRDAVESYLRRSSFDVLENANRYPGPSGLLYYVAEKALDRLINSKVPSKFMKLHLSGYIHIHKLPLSLFIPYCSGHSVKRVLTKGLKTPTIHAAPAKHLDTFADHITNYLVTMQHYFSGAQAFSAVELYAGAFIRSDGLDYTGVKQNVQRIVFNLNFPSRAGLQTPFTNFTVVLDASERLLNEHAVLGRKSVGELGAYLDEAKLFLRALAEVLEGGDASGAPFTFPIPTVMTTSKEIYSDPELFTAVFNTAAKRGSFYWLNTNIVNPDTTYAMCCRININFEEISRSIRYGSVVRLHELRNEVNVARERLVQLIEKLEPVGMWSIPDVTGSLAVVTINLPRLALESRSDDGAFYEGLYSILGRVRKVLMWLRERYVKLARRYPDLYSMPIMYVPEVFTEGAATYFNTVGIIGLPEASAIMQQNPALWLSSNSRSRREAVDWMRGVVEFIVRTVREWSVSDYVPYNVEEVPGESAAARLAQADAERYPEVLDYLPDPTSPIYSTSIVPYYADIGMSERVRLEAKVQKYFTGGVMLHLFLNEEPDPEALAKLTRRLSGTELIYWSYTPALTICRNCGFRSVGAIWVCPKCGSETEVWSRIIGYYRPVKNWNPARRREFKQRVHYGRGQII
ncbi:MAG: anaerobic ribonucleoside-triphosphate reductase [Desulfurococcales archaeon ex4484_204]|nr:MAG: anaerobic ribonucleoside-triphosphate reductase [Desulfurococcales archaeon ex4484_204]